ncbi:ABC transporter permease [uncultured Serinicoccus sp.]|uniref:ABC transporter permease n=1 Tax=uncultured Serinicoccus sp. TaxID=735514 RepID=UPI002605E454|nr:ABC transporter permease [uncultured Serinicoccus sp.]
MLLLIAKRLGMGAVTLVLVSLITFGLLHLTPGDPAQVAAGPDADEAAVDAARQRLGLDRSLVVQYASWAGNLLRGDLGTSFVQNRAVLDMILERLPVTLSLVGLSLVVSLLIALPLGVLAATRRDTILDRGAVLWASTGIALPDFFLGLLLVLAFAIHLGWFPATGFVPLGENPGLWLTHLVLPAVTLGTTVAAELTRHIRASLSDVLELDYVRTARAKGIGGSRVVLKHAMRNAALPVMTVFGIQLARLLGGTVIVEQIFNLPGIGQLIVASIFQRDLPVILGMGVFIASMVLVVNLLVDISYGWLNPKVRT